MTPPDNLLAEAIQRVTEAVEKREAGVQNDRRKDERVKRPWDDQRLADERSYATVASIRLDDLQALLAATQRNERLAAALGDARAWIVDTEDENPEEREIVKQIDTALNEARHD